MSHVGIRAAKPENCSDKNIPVCEVGHSGKEFDASSHDRVAVLIARFARVATDYLSARQATPIFLPYSLLLDAYSASVRLPLCFYFNPLRGRHRSSKKAGSLRTRGWDSYQKIELQILTVLSVCCN